MQNNTIIHSIIVYIVYIVYVVQQPMPLTTRKGKSSLHAARLKCAQNGKGNKEKENTIEKAILLVIAAKLYWFVTYQS